MNKGIIVLAMVLIAGFFSNAVAQDHKEQDFLTDFDQAFKKALQENKPLLIDFGHPW